MITSEPTAFNLTNWQKKQAAMLYHYASLDYLKGLQKLVSELVDGIVDPILTTAKQQNRDSVLATYTWGQRNTTQNWTNNAWPFLKDLQRYLARDIAARSMERYAITPVNDCFRGMSEFSMQWATIEEEGNFKAALSEISEYARYLDETVNDLQYSRWTDYEFAVAYSKFSNTKRQQPKFRVRVDVAAESGHAPPRTGVYVVQQDTYAGLQFAWTGNSGGKLRPANTLNDIGKAALKEVGRDDLWLNDEKMFNFAMKSSEREIFKPKIYILGDEYRGLASGAVAEHSFKNYSAKWFFVEIENGEYEDFVSEPWLLIDGIVAEKVHGGEHCRVTGFYFTPAHANSRRRLVKGEKAPEWNSEYGKTIWQWDTNQLDG